MSQTEVVARIDAINRDLQRVEQLEFQAAELYRNRRERLIGALTDVQSACRHPRTDRGQKCKACGLVTPNPHGLKHEKD